MVARENIFMHRMLWWNIVLERFSLRSSTDSPKRATRKFGQSGGHRGLDGMETQSSHNSPFNTGKDGWRRESTIQKQDNSSSSTNRQTIRQFRMHLFLDSAKQYMKNDKSPEYCLVTTKARSLGSEDFRQRSVEKPNMAPMIFVGIPAFNVERNIAKIVVQARQHCDKVIVCDDGSSDETGRIAESLGCTVVRHSRNLGYGAAIRTLIDTARKEGADVLVTVDGDGQHSPKEISALVDPIVQGRADLVIGTRFGLADADRNIPKFRKLGIRAITKLVNGLSKQSITDAQSGFRAYGKRALSTIHPGEQGMGASTEILLEAKASELRVLEVPTTVRYSSDSRSTHNPAYHFADVIASTMKVASLHHPLLFFGIPGVFFLATSMAFGVWALNIFSQEGRLVTNLTLISIGTAIIGIILLTAGVLLFTLVTLLRGTRNLEKFQSRS